MQKISEVFTLLALGNTTQAMRRLSVRFGVGILLVFLLGSMAFAAVNGARMGLRPPSEPAIRPQLSSISKIDVDNNRLDDLIDVRVQSARIAMSRQMTRSKRVAAAAALEAPSRVELVFDQPITQQQIDDFLSLGGQIEYIYQTISYGWIGWVPLNVIDQLPQAMGPSLLGVVADRSVQTCDLGGTQAGRARPVWQLGFGGSANGFTGSSQTTIAILDSGLDGTHMDLAGRMEYWRDFTTEAYPTPVDYNGHGSHVTGIALGTGANSGLFSDGFYNNSGVAPGCHWAGMKVMSGGVGSWNDASTALDMVITERSAHNIKVINLSMATDRISFISDKINTVVNYGVIVCAAAGNSGPTGTVGSPGSAAYAITVGASNMSHQLMSWSSCGFTAPNYNEDNKPDLIAPGDSITSVHSNLLSPLNDNSYMTMSGTSMASPFVAGAAALVIQALEQNGMIWNWSSNAQPLLVKMLFCATSTESNLLRSSGGFDPPLGRAASPKDIYEGYGMINVDAAVEAVTVPYNSQESGTTNGGIYDRRAWGRNWQLNVGVNYNVTLTVPSTGDFDLYLYSDTPDSKGNPVILQSSATAGNGLQESIDFVAPTNMTVYLVVKRVSGSGTWSLSSPSPSGLTIFQPTANQWVKGTITLSGSISGGGSPVYSWLLDGSNTIVSGNSATPSNPWNSTTTGDGSHTITLSSNSVTDVHTIKVDNTFPVVTLTAPTANQYVGSSMTTTGSASDSNLSGWQVKADGTTNLLTGSTPTWNQSVSISSLSEGSHSIQATATDLAGNSGLSTARTIIVDRSNPTVLLSSPTRNQRVGSSMNIKGSATDTNLSGWQVKADGATILLNGSTPTWDQSVSTSSLSEGSHSIQATATDLAGNSGSSTSKSITVDRNPTVVLNTPTSNQFVSSSMNVSGSASDSTLSGWQVKADGTTNLLTGSTTTWNQSVSTSSLNEGSHSIQVTATDIAGNSGLSTSITITVDRINPSVVINTPTDGANVSGTVSIGATIIDANPDTWVILLDGGQIANGTGTSPSTTWNAPSIGGSHIIRVEATDKVGNVGASQITVNTVTPDVTFTGTIKLGGWVGSVTPISSLPVQVTIDGGAPSSVSMTGTGNTATFQVSLPPTGIHNVRAKPNKFLSQTLTVTTSGSNIAGTFDGPTHAGLIQGDVTDNNVIDDFDFNAIITNFGNVGTIYDSNGDNVVDDFDFNAIIVNFGSTGS